MVRMAVFGLEKVSRGDTDIIMSRLGVKTRIFHLGDYRRENVGPGQSIPEDYFFVNGWLEAHSNY